MMTQPTFAENLRKIRENNHVSQRQLAYFVGVTDKVISKWETGVSLPKADMLAQLARYFGVTADQLIGIAPPNAGNSTAPQSPCEITLPPLPVPEPIADTNLIPDAPCWNGNYLCTWANQEIVARRLGITGEACADQRDALTEETLFGKENYFHPLDRTLRGDVILLLDDGWDVPFGTPHDAAHERMFGSVDPDPARFSGTTPITRLKNIVRRAADMGYAGVGLWISPQRAGIDPAEDTPAAARAYWCERARRCFEAGIRYWKVDWGLQDNPDYRRMMTEAVRHSAPGLWIEHACGRAPITAICGGEEMVRRYTAAAHKLLPISDVYRVYDVMPPFYTVCVMDRFDIIARQVTTPEHGTEALVNVESHPLIAAALGGTYGIMDYSPETAACLRWQRIAPAFGLYTTDYHASEKRLTDTAFFDIDPLTWVPCGGKHIEESAPAVISRGCPLPQVYKCGTYAPFVAASRHPVTGATAVAALRRTVDPNRCFVAPADITVTADPRKPIGVFGVMNSLTLELDSPLTDGFHLLAQDLLDDSPRDITDRVTVLTSRTVRLDGYTLRRYGKLGHAVGDTSDPTLILQFTE